MPLPPSLIAIAAPEVRAAWDLPEFDEAPRARQRRGHPRRRTGLVLAGLAAVLLLAVAWHLAALQRSAMVFAADLVRAAAAPEPGALDPLADWSELGHARPEVRRPGLGQGAQRYLETLAGEIAARVATPEGLHAVLGGRCLDASAARLASVRLLPELRVAVQVAGCDEATGDLDLVMARRARATGGWQLVGVSWTGG